MASITFKAKARNVWEDDALAVLAYQFIEVPTLTRKHCDMAAFRQHPKFGGLANSDLFPNVLARIKRDVGGSYGRIRLDRLPANVTIDASGFLCSITIEV